MPNRRKKLLKTSEVGDMPVPKNGRQTNAKSHISGSQEKRPEYGNPAPRTTNSPVNGHIDNCQDISKTRYSRSQDKRPEHTVNPSPRTSNSPVIDNMDSRQGFPKSVDPRSLGKCLENTGNPGPITAGPVSGNMNNCQGNAKFHNSKSQEKRPGNGNPGTRTKDSPVNGSIDGCQGKCDTDDFPGNKETDSFLSSRDSTGFNNNGKVNGLNGTIKIDENGNDRYTGIHNDTTKVDGYNRNNGYHGSRVYSSNGKNRMSGSYDNKTGGSRGNSKSGGFYGNTKPNRPQSNGKPDGPSGNTKKDVLHENATENDAPGKPQAVSNKLVDSSIHTNGCDSDANPILAKSNEKQNIDAQAKDRAVIKKYSEEPLSFFQPDLGKSTPGGCKSPSVEELCAKWPSVEPASECEASRDRENIPTKKGVQSCESSPIQQNSRAKSPVSNEFPKNDRCFPKNGASKKWEYTKLAPRFVKSHQKGAYPIQIQAGTNNDMNQLADNSSHAEYNSAGSRPSSNFYGQSGRKQSGDFGNNARNNQRGSPHKSDQSGLTYQSNADHFNADDNHDETRVDYGEMNFRNQYHSSQGRGQRGPQNSMSRGGLKRNKNGRKFNNQNGYLGNKHWGRPGPDQKSPLGQHDKAGLPVGYYGNHEAYTGQNLVSAVPPFMVHQGMPPQMTNHVDGVQSQMISPVGAMPPQMVSSVGPPMLSPVQFAEDQQYTMAIFPSGYQWIDVGSQSEGQQVLVQANGEVVPLTMANVMPYIVPYTAGLPNTGVPMLIPAVAPPPGTGMNAPTTMNGQDLTNSTGSTPQMPNDHPDPNYAVNNANFAYQNINVANVTYPTSALTISHSVSSHVGPISACSEAQNQFSQSQLEKSWECGTPTRAPSGTPGFDPPNHNQVNGEHMSQLVSSGSSHHRSDTPESTVLPNQAIAQVASPVVADRLPPPQTPGTPLYGTPGNFIFDTPGTSNGTPSGSWNGTPGAWNETPSKSTGTPGHSGPLNVTPSTPQNAAESDAKGQLNKVKMMSLAQVERMQRMSSANGKRVPTNARSKDSPNHVPPAPQEVQEELVKFICDSWNKVNQDIQKGSTTVACYDSDPCTLEGFVPFDLEAYWGKRLVQNMTNQNIPTQNM